MDPVNNSNVNASQFNPLGAISSFSSSLHRLTKLFKAVALGALAFTSPASARYVVRYDGGVNVPHPQDFNALLPARQEFGPFNSPVPQCLCKDLPSGACSNEDLSVLTAYASDTQKTPGPLEPYLKKAGDLSPTYASPLTRFPENLSAFYSNGLGAVGNGEKACYLNPLEIYPECDAEAKLLTKLIRKQGMHEQIYANNPHEDGGMILAIPSDKGDPIRVVVGKDPREHMNYRNALEYAEKNILQDPCFFSKSVKEIQNTLIRLQEIIVNGLPMRGSDTKTIGTGYRNDYMLVSRTLGSSMEEFIKKLTEMGATKKEIQLFKNSVERSRHAKVEDITSILTKEERAVWDKINYFPPAPKEVPGLMRDFISKLKEYALGDMHPAALAAWAHCEIGSIHPFDDGNGRVARILMYSLLGRGGYSPVIFPDDDVYSEWVNADQATPGAFVDFLISLIESQRVGKQVLFYKGEENTQPLENSFLDYFKNIF